MTRTSSWHHRLNGHESEQAPGDGEGQGSRAGCMRFMGFEELDTTERPNNSNNLQVPHTDKSLAGLSHLTGSF